MAYGTLKADAIQSDTTGTPPQFNDGNGTQTGTLCRAWVNFNGTGTVTIRASFNVSSITDNGTGDYTVNFTNAMPDANYCVNGLSSDSPTINTVMAVNNTAVSSSSVRIATFNPSGSNTLVDRSYNYVAVFR
jgi:hypothetical protein